MSAVADLPDLPTVAERRRARRAAPPAGRPRGGSGVFAATFAVSCVAHAAVLVLAPGWGAGARDEDAASRTISVTLAAAAPAASSEVASDARRSPAPESSPAVAARPAVATPPKAAPSHVERVLRDERVERFERVDRVAAAGAASTPSSTALPSTSQALSANPLEPTSAAALPAPSGVTLSAVDPGTGSPQSPQAVAQGALGRAPEAVAMAAPGAARGRSVDLPATPVERIEPPHFGLAYLNNPPPDYPDVARRMQLEGTVVVRVLVNARGTPEETVVARTSGAAVLDEAALRAVRAWRFVPAKRGETPVAHWAEVPLHFRLRD